MANTGAPWNLPYPLSTDLVIDGAQAIEDLAEAVADGLDATKDAGNIVSGTMDAARIGSGTFDAARIPNLNATTITAGTLDGARLPGFVLSNVVVFFSSGTWTRPAGCRAIRVRVQGGGGGGASSVTNDLFGTGGGGGGGGYAERFVISPAASYAVTVGGVSGSTATGNPSSVGDLATGNGGGGSTSRFGGGGGGGTASGGFVVQGGGGRGGSASSTDNLGDGGGSFLGPPRPGITGTGNTRFDGFNGIPYGGGGNSFLCQSGATRGGSSGAEGIVIIEEYL